MSQAIFNYLDQNKDTIFKTYSIPRGYIEGYRSTSNGFQVLYQTLSVNHPALVDLVSSKEDQVKPTFEMYDNNIYTFCNALKDFYDYEYKGLSSRPEDFNRKVVKYIKSQLVPDQRYKKAIDYIDDELKRIYDTRNRAILPFPTDLTLEGTVAVTLMKQLPRNIFEDINNSLAVNNDSHLQPSYSINRMNTRNDKRKTQKYKFKDLGDDTNPQAIFEKIKNKRFPSTDRSPIDAICAACGKSGHDINSTGCDAMAQFKLLMQYNKDRNSRKIETATRKYKQYQKDRHSKRNFSKEIEDYKTSIKTFQSTMSDVDIAVIKQMHLESFREDVDPTAPDDLFDNIQVEDGQMEPRELYHSSDESSTTSQE